MSVPKVIHERERVPEAEINNCLLPYWAAKYPLCEYTLHSTLDALSAELPNISNVVEYFLILMLC